MTINTIEKQPDKINVPVTSNDYRKALDLAEAGKHKEALLCIQKYLVSSPDNPEILNDTGAILYSLNRSEEAIKHFLKAKKLQPDSAEILWNLSETYLAEGKTKETMELFNDMERIGILNSEILNRTAEKLINARNLSDALVILNKSLELSPNQPILLSIIKIISSKIAGNKT